MTHALEADSVKLHFGDRAILTNVYLKCETGTIMGLLGRNGQGKSCLMKIIYGTLNCEKSVRIDNVARPKPSDDMACCFIFRSSTSSPDLFL